MNTRHSHFTSAIINTVEAPMSDELFHLQHQLRILRLLVEEYRLKTKRLAIEATYYALLYKLATKQEVSHE